MESIQIKDSRGKSIFFCGKLLFLFFMFSIVPTLFLLNPSAIYSKGPKPTPDPAQTSLPTPTPANIVKTTERPFAGSIRKNSIGMELIYVPPGSFMMGSSEDDIAKSFRIAQKENKYPKRKWFDNEKPQHLVRISEGFWMGKYEVTQGTVAGRDG